MTGVEATTGNEVSYQETPIQSTEDSNTMGAPIKLEDFVGVWHTRYLENGVPECEIEILSVNEDGVKFDVSWYRLDGYENVQTYYFLKESDITDSQIFLHYTTERGSGGTLTFEKGRITLSIGGTPYVDGEYVFETRGNRML